MKNMNINNNERTNKIKIGDLIFLDNDFSIIWEVVKIEPCFYIGLRNASFKYGYFSTKTNKEIWTEEDTSSFISWQQKLNNSNYIDIIKTPFIQIKDKIDNFPMSKEEKRIIVSICLNLLPPVNQAWGIYRCDFNNITGVFQRSILEEPCYFNKKNSEYELNKVKNNYFFNCISVLVEAQDFERAKIQATRLYNQASKENIISII